MLFPYNEVTRKWEGPGISVCDANTVSHDFK